VFLGITGLMHRQDGHGVALRFALWPEAQGAGLAREAASAALFFAHDQAGLARVVAVARVENYGSRIVLGAVGMAEAGRFMRDGNLLVLYQSVRSQNAG
jgi:RimJ/RimL family protein N-acetyltransferase